MPIRWYLCPVIDRVFTVGDPIVNQRGVPKLDEADAELAALGAKFTRG